MTTISDTGLRIAESQGGAAVLHRACTLPAPQARAAVGSLLAIQCGARRIRLMNAPGLVSAVERRNLSRRHYALRAPKIARLHAAIDHLLALAKHETLAKVAAHFDQTPQPLVNADPPSFAQPSTLNPQPSLGGVVGDLVFDLSKFRDQLTATLRDAALSTLNEAGQEFDAELPSDRRPADPFTMPNPDALQFLAERENKLRDVPDEIHRQIADTIAEGMDGGESLAQISRRITGEFDGIATGRAQTIASTETASAYGRARQAGMERAGIRYRTWLTSHLPNVRDAHAFAEDDDRNFKVPIDQPFHVGGELLMYPGDPHGSPENVINCHCVALALAEEEAA